MTNLPISMLPIGQLQSMRNQANGVMTEQVRVCSIDVAYNDYGQQVVTSGLLFTSSGYVGKISGRDRELLERLNYTGTETETMVTILLPFANEVHIDEVIHAQNKEWRVIWSNADTQDSVQIYEKAICARYIIETEKRKVNNG